LLKIKIEKSLGGLVDGSSSDANRESRDAAGGFMLDVAFEVPAGVTILFGASGSGKSLTLKSIAGLVQPDAGLITVGESVLFDSARGINLPIRERRTGFVFQNLALLPHLSAARNVEFAMTDLPKSTRRAHAMSLLENFNVGYVAERRPRYISGGEAQRVALARALAARPKMLLLDEPLSALDEPTKLAIISDLKRINRELRLPVVYVTHSREEAIALGERIVVYERGRVAAIGEPLDVFGSPIASSVARLTSVENIFEGHVTNVTRHAGTMTVALIEGEASCSVDVPLARYEIGERVTIAVRSGDILLATEEPRATSARNVLHGEVSSIEERGGYVLVRVACGVVWSVSVTRQAVEELQIVNAARVWLAIKSHSCHLLNTDE